MGEEYEAGIKIIQQLVGEQGIQALQEVAAFSPDFAKIIAEFAFGKIYSRPLLDSKQREFITLSSLITQGAGENQLQFHFNAALNLGIPLAEIVEIIIHCTVYVGIPRAMNALFILQKVAHERNAEK